jgi:sporulation protein YlmC with PRC-barrel domain
MSRTATTTLVKLGETDMRFAQRDADVRGFAVTDRDRNEIGSVQELLIDERGQQVRFLEVASGGFLGIGDETRLVPVDAIARVEDETIVVDSTRQHVHRAPVYDPELVSEDEYYQSVYDHYGLAPYWAAGHVPRYPRA